MECNLSVSLQHLRPDQSFKVCLWMKDLCMYMSSLTMSYKENPSALPPVSSAVQPSRNHTTLLAYPLSSTPFPFIPASIFLSYSISNLLAQTFFNIFPPSPLLRTVDPLHLSSICLISNSYNFSEGIDSTRVESEAVL